MIKHWWPAGKSQKVGLLLAAFSLFSGCSPSVSTRALYEIPGGDAARGWQAMTEYGCAACHTIPGVTRANAKVGPPLTEWATRGDCR